MTKHFCDICGAPAIDGRPDVAVERPIGEPYQGAGDMAVVACQCRVVVRAHFSFAQHPTGFGGPPDLCRLCREQLLRKLAEEAAS